MTALTLAEVKLHLRVDHSAEDSLIQQYMAAAHDQVEQFLDRSVPWDVTSAVPDGEYPAAVWSVVGSGEDWADVAVG